MRISAVAAILLLLSGLQAPSASGQDVLIVHPDQPIYASAARALGAALRAAGTTSSIHSIPTGDARAAEQLRDRLRRMRPKVVAAAGEPLTLLVLETLPEAVVIHFMTLNAADTAMAADTFPHANRVAGVSCDVAPDELLGWIAETTPAVRRVAVLHSDRTRRTADALVAAGRRRRVEVIAVPAERERFADATARLSRERVEGVIMIPDAAVYNAPNVEHLLVWALREKRATFAFSENVVAAGALAGIHADPERVGRETAQLVRRVMNSRLPDERILYVESLNRAVNSHTAGLLGIDLAPALRRGDVTEYGK